MANSMAGTSNDTARALGGEYHVFLSFRGPDTRYAFADFLNDRLVDAGVHVFMDENKLCVGEVIGENLLRAINNSILYIPIFSPTYVSSKWCLRELVHIVDNESKSKGKKSILPIFFHVELDDIKLKTQRYIKDFSKHEKEFPEEVEAWREALAKVDEIKGWKVKKKQSQAKIVKLVVEKVLETLEIKQKSATGDFIGLDDKVKVLKESLDVNHHDVRLLAIYGMGGIGKTTIATVIFNQLSSHFGKYCSFLENVRETLLTEKGIVRLQKKLLSDTGFVENIEDSERGMRRIGDTLRTRKVLVVLDDVDNKEHIKKLIGNFSLHSGSRIIITTRNTSILEVEGFEGEILSYEMLKMDFNFATQLFYRHAFGRDYPLDDYPRLSNEIVSRTGGLPLAIKVIGSLLNGKNKAFWEETLVRLRNVPEEKILKKLRISYDDLDEYQQQIFLDIACFFFNEKKADAIYMWAGCQFYPERGIDVLISRCLIKILDDDKFWMHDQLIDLGRQIVRQESPSALGNRSRLWIATESLQILRSEERKDKVQALEIDGLDDSIEITNEELERLQNLRFLKLGNGTFAGDFAKCRSTLRWISWHSPHQDFRADNMYLEHLLVFKLNMNDFTDDSKAWELIKKAQKLKVLSLTGCHGIMTIPDFSKCLNLEKLTIARCSKLKRIESFIGDLHSLIELEIEVCTGLTNLPEEVGALVSLTRFSLQGCSGLRELPDSFGNLTSLIELDLSRTGIAKLPDSIEGLVKLESFLLTDTKIRELSSSIEKLKSLRVLRLSIHGSYSSEHRVWQFPSGISILKNLEELDLSGRYEVQGEVPIGIEELSSLRILNLKYTRIRGIPGTINRLHHLQTLNLLDCNEIKELPELPTSLTCLLLRSKSLLTVPTLSNLTNLVELQLSDGSRITGKTNIITGCNLRWIGRLSKLKKLELDLLNVPAPPELASLSHLEQLTLSNLDLETSMQFPSSLLKLDFRSLSIRRVELLPSFLGLTNLLTLKFYQCEVKDIPLKELPCLEKFSVESCLQLQRLFIPLELKKLREVDVLECSELVEIQILDLLKSLESLSIYKCKSLTCIGGLSYLTNLKKLEVQRCDQLANVEGLDELVSLKSLNVGGCMSLRKLIDVSCTNIPDDCLVKIQGCGDFIKDSTQISSSKISLKNYREKIKSNSESKSNKTRYEGNQEIENIPANRDAGGTTRVASSSGRGTASSSGNGAAFSSGSGRGSSSRNGFDFKKWFTKTPACFRRS